MSSGIYVALAGARAQSRALDSVARNIANTSTAGYKAERSTFAESLTVVQQAEDQRYVADRFPALDMSQGAIRSTGNPLDVALEGEGFFAVSAKNGERYTRDGAFRVSSEGTLVTSVGAEVLDTGGSPIDIPSDAADIYISESGTVMNGTTVLGELKLVNFGEESLRRVGDNMYEAIGEPVEDAPPPVVVSESLEMSNFQAVRGVIELIKVQRSFQALLQMIENYKESEGRAARALGGPK